MGCQASWDRNPWADGMHERAGGSRALRTPRGTRLTRLSACVLSGTCLALGGHGGLGLPTMPLRSAARGVKCGASVPGGWTG
jgi:hypothetical protein